MVGVPLHAGPVPTTSPAAKRSRRAIVVEQAAGQGYADRLGPELLVVQRLEADCSAAELNAALTEHEPKLLLCTQSLDSIDETFLAVCRAHRAKVFVLAHPVYGVFKPMRLRRFGGLPWLQVRPRSRWSGDERAKRTFDLVVIVLSLPIALPLLLLLTLAVGCTGRPFYFQVRVGAKGRRFRMVKFRTMVVDAEKATGPTLSGGDDLRVTKVGKLLRRSRMDELPQLWNVVRGQMSLVGPRPERPEFVTELRRLPHYELRELIRPGLTGIAQLTGGYGAAPEDKLRCDLLYLNSRSVRSDLVLLLLTFTELFRGFPRG